MIKSVTLLSIAAFCIFLNESHASALIVNSVKYGQPTCVYYEYEYFGGEYCHTVRSDIVEDWIHRYGDVSCSYNCGNCSYLSITNYIYDKYGKKWVSVSGWTGQKISIAARDELIANISPYLKPTGVNINSISCNPEIPCGQTPQETYPLLVNSVTYGENTCVYYDYSIQYAEYGHTLRANVVNSEGWSHSFGGVTCDYNCTNHYYLNLTTYIYNKNSNQWMTISGWSGQKIDAREGCKLLEQINLHKKPAGNINTIPCSPYTEESQFGPVDQCK